MAGRCASTTLAPSIGTAVCCVAGVFNDMEVAEKSGLIVRGLSDREFSPQGAFDLSIDASANRQVARRGKIALPVQIVTQYG